jgi:hypothetical protein
MGHTAPGAVTLGKDDPDSPDALLKASRRALAELHERLGVGPHLAQRGLRPRADALGDTIDRAGFVMLDGVEPLLEPLQPGGRFSRRRGLA